MTEIEIIKELFKAHASHNEIVVELENHETVVGEIAFFDGDKVTIENKELPISLITSVGEPIRKDDNTASVVEIEYNTEDLEKLLMKNVLLKKVGQEDKTIEGLLYAINDERIVVLSDMRKWTVERRNISDLCEKTDIAVFNKDIKSELNIFEKAIVNADKDTVLNLIDNPERMFFLGYSLEEITRLTKSVRQALPWNDEEKNKAYNQARRLYEIEGNRGNIAYSLFYEFLLEDGRPFDLRCKAVGTVLDIVAGVSVSELMFVCDEYRELIIQRESLCYKAACLLISKGMIEFARKLVGAEGNNLSIQGIDPFDSKVSYKELFNILLVPNKYACSQLLSQYANQERHAAFFSIVRLMLPEIREDVSNIENLRKEFTSCDAEFLNEYLKKFPLLWMDSDIAARYIEFNSEKTALNLTEKSLMVQCLRSVQYVKANEIEETLIRADYKSFDVLRSNNSILFSCGYDANEITIIQEADVGELQKKTIIERLMMIEGNKNHVAESMAWKDFLRLPKAVCSELFPILISEGNAGLVVELFNYSNRVNEQLKSLKPLYLRALMILGEREALWILIKDEWLELESNSELLLYSISLAEEHGQLEQASAMRAYSQMSELNEFEMALVKGNAPKLKLIVSDVNNLTEMGYDSDEISLIVESTHHRVDFKSDDKVAIANRVFTFQKNKNGVAEFYYKIALLDGSSMAAYGLFAVYENENRAKDLCDIFETHLTSNEDMITEQMRGSYLHALYELGRFNEFVEYFNSHKGVADITDTILLEVLLITKADVSEISELLPQINADTYDDVLMLKNCIKLCLVNVESSEYVKFAITLFNSIFCQLEQSDLSEIIYLFEKIDKMKIMQPMGNGVLAILTKRESYLKEWCEYLKEKSRDEKAFVKTLEKIDSLIVSPYFSGSDSIREVVLNLYQSRVMITESLEKYLVPEFENVQEKLAWMDDCFNCASEIDELRFSTFCKFAHELEKEKELVELICLLSSRKNNNLRGLKNVIIDLINTAVDKNDHGTIAVLLDAILNLAGNYQLFIKDVIVLYKAYALVGNKEYAYIADKALGLERSFNDDENRQIMLLRNELYKDNNLSLFSVIDKELRKIQDCHVIELFNMWKGLFRITEEDTSAMEELRDYYNSPEKWSVNAKELLAKHLFCNIKSELYWKLLKQYYSDSESEIKLNIEYQYAKTKPEVFDAVILVAQKQKLYAQLVDIVNYVLAETNVTVLEKCYRPVCRTLNKCSGVFSSSEVAIRYIKSLFENEKLINDGNALRFVLEVSERAEKVSKFAEQYISSCEVYDPLFLKKLLCKLLLEDKINEEVVKKAIDILSSASHDVAYSKMLIDMWLSASFNDEVSREILFIIQENEQENVDENLLYRLYTKSVINGQQTVFIKAIEQVKNYYPELSVYDDFKKYELTSSSIEDNEVSEVYADEFSQLVRILDPDRILKTIINMLPGEIFLSQKNITHDSVLEYGMTHLSTKELENLKFNHDIYISVCDAFSENREFLCLFMKACFLRQWKDVVLFDASNKYINDVLKRDNSVKKILLKRHFEVLKWVFLSLLDVDDNDESVIDRAYTLLSASCIVRFNRNTLRRLYKMDEYNRNIVRKIFSIRMESATLRNLGYAGEAILEIEDNEKVAYLICTLPPSDLSVIFNNEACFEVLMNLPFERAQHVAEIYVGLFSEGRDNVFSRAVASIQSSNTVFDISNNPYDDDAAATKFLRKKYLKQLNVIENAGDSVTKQMLKNFEIMKAEYLYSAVMFDSLEDINELNPNRMDYISVLTLLFNKKDSKDIKDFVWKLDKEVLLPLYAYILQMLEQYVAAYKILDLINDEEWKKILIQVQYRAMTGVYLNEEERVIRSQIQQNIDIDRSYWLGKFLPVTEEQVPNYLGKIKALYELCFEFKEYLLYNGENISGIQLDEVKFTEHISRIENKYLKHAKTEENTNETQNETSSECVADYLANDILETMISSATAEVINNLEHIPQTYEECMGAIKFYATVKRESKNRKDIATFKDLVRWVFLKKMDEEGYSRDKFLGVLKLISRDDMVGRSQWHVIISYMVKYFESISSLSQLSRMMENDLSLLQVISGGESKNHKMFRRGDLKIWKNIEAILSEISGVDYLRLSETEQMQCLTTYRTKLLSNGNEKELTAFFQINNSILRLINEQITGLKNAAELIISVEEEEKGQNVSIVWEKNNNVGYLYAVISNNGGASCENVILTSKINVSRVRSFEINKIYSGERVPFRELFRVSDLTDGKLSWDIEVSYFDSNKGKTVIVMHHITATVSTGDDGLDLGNISTGNPAKGTNFVGRTRELALLRSRYADEEQLPSMLIRGLKRSGKSSILIQLTEILKNRNQFVVVFVDGQSVGDDIKNAFINKVVDGIRISYRNVDEYKNLIANDLDKFKSEWQEKTTETDWIGQLDIFYYELSQLLGKKVLVIIDEMESIFYNHRFDSIAQEETLYAALRALIQKAGNFVSFIFCGSDTLLSSCLEQRSESQMFQTLQYLEVGHMNHGDIQEIFRRQSDKYEINFSPDAVEAIWEYTDGLVWYAKLLGYLVINNIFANDLTIRKNVNRWDILYSVQMLINGEIGTDKYDLVDACLNTSRTAIVHAMASIMPDYNKVVTVDEILVAVKMMKMEGYINPRNGEEIPNMNEGSIKEHLEFLEKMQFVEPNETKTKYQFTAELYRLFFRTDKKLHIFEERGIQ